MICQFKNWTLVTFLLLLVTGNAAGNTIFGELESLPPGEQYRQLSLITLIAGSADPALLDSITPQNIESGGRAAPELRPDDYKTPLVRIVDQKTMLDGAAFLLRFAQESEEDIRASLVAINTHNVMPRETIAIQNVATRCSLSTNKSAISTAQMRPKRVISGAAEMYAVISIA